MSSPSSGSAAFMDETGAFPSVPVVFAFGGAAHAASLITFVLGLGLAITIVLPLTGGAAVIGGARFATRVRGFVYRRISFDLQVSDEEAIV